MKRYVGRVAGVGVVCLFVLMGWAQDAPQLPDTKPGQMMAQWMKLCDTADLAQMKKWGEENLTKRFLERVGAETFAKRQGADCEINGGYKLIRVLDSNPDRLSVLAVGRQSDAYVDMRLMLEADGKARGVGTLPAMPPESALPKDLSDKSVEEAIGAYTDKLVKSDQFSGIAIVARGTQPIVTKSGGYADRAKKTAITPQSQFTIGSMGKMFTAAAIGQLVDQGKMSFDDTVGKFFPDFANVTVREKVTVGMLLSHTSGMGDFLRKRTPEMMKNGVKRAAEFVPLYEKDEPRFEPGKGWSYSNAGLALAGAIVEKVSGEDYPTYIRKHIFDVAGMKNSDPNNIPHSDARLVTPYTESEKPDAPQRWQEAEHDIGSPAGGAISTAEDLVKFADALRSGKLVSKATFQKMTQGHGPTPFGRQYGYATEVDDVYGRTVVGHGGGFPGVSTHLYIVLDSPYTAVVLANQDPPAAEIVGETAKAIVAEKAKSGK